MQVNNYEFKIDDLLSEMDFSENMHQFVNDHLMLTPYQITVLNQHQIDYTQVFEVKALVSTIERVLENTPDEDLELIADELTQRIYYENTNK